MNKACSIIIIATVLAGVALGIQSASTDADSFSVGPPERIEEGPASQAGLLGMAEYYCHWNRFHAAVMIMFTDAAIELGEHVDAMREISPPDELESLVLEFNESNWKEYGKKLGGIGLANGLDERSAAPQQPLLVCVQHLWQTHGSPSVRMVSWHGFRETQSV